MPAAGSTASGPVLLYDGECGLCRACVRLLLRADRAGRLRFAPLQGAAAQAWLRARGLPTEDFDTLLFVPEWPGTDAVEPLVRTDGALAACAAAGGVAGALAGLRHLPRPWRDAAYRGIARVRRRVLPAPGPDPRADPRWSGRFLRD
jgi:predicted DCC family thiol-disulfide oxidoreductase YuxK